MFVAAIDFIVTKRLFYSKALIWLGKYTFPIYMLQRLSMMLLASICLPDINKNLYLAVVLLCTVLIAWGFDKSTKKLGAFLGL